MMMNLMSVTRDCPVFLLMQGDEDDESQRTHVGGPRELCAALEDPTFAVVRVMALLSPYLTGKGWTVREVDVCWRSVDTDPAGLPFLIWQLDGSDYLLDGVIRTAGPPEFQMRRIFSSPNIAAAQAT